MTNVMSFGALTPIAVRVVGTDLREVRKHAEKIVENMKRIEFLRDIQFEQQLDYPSVEVVIDREKAGLSGVTVDDVAHAMIMATSSTRFTNLNYWVDVKTGFDYLVQIQVPPLRLETPEDIGTLPLESVNPLVNLMIRDVAEVRQGTRPGEVDRDMSQRYLTITANVEGEDMGRAAGQVADAIKADWRAASWGSGRADGSIAADDPDVRGARDWPGCRGVCDLCAPDGILPIAALGPCVDQCRAWRGRGNRHDAVSVAHDAQYRIVYGFDHVFGRFGVELGDACDIYVRTLERRLALRSMPPLSGRVTAFGRS